MMPTALRLVRSSLLALPLVAAIAACGGDGTTNTNSDMRMTATPDMAVVAPPKLTIPTSCAQAAVDYMAAYTNVVSKKCGGSTCHLGGGTTFPRYGTAADFKTNTVNVPFAAGSNFKYITPNNPDLSYLLFKLTGQQTSVPMGGGDRMPQPPNAALSDADLCTMINWVRSGAN